jgi:hypothetical protein
MDDRDYRGLLRFRDIVHGVRETPHQGPADVLTNSRKLFGIPADGGEEGTDGSRELATQARHPFLVPREGFLQLSFRLGLDEKARPSSAALLNVSEDVLRRAPAARILPMALKPAV